MGGKALGLMSRIKTGILFADAATKDCYIYWNTRVKYPENIFLGKSVRIGSDCVLGAMGGISLGNNVRVSKGVIIETGGLDFSGDAPYLHVAKPIRIEDGVWIGANAIILGGVTIGRNAVVGAGAVVTRDVSENSIAAGNPARTVRSRLQPHGLDTKKF